MKHADRAVDLEIRPYTQGDEPAVLELLNASLGGGPAGRRSSKFFSWKHYMNPFGRSFMLVAEVDGAVVGLRAFMYWEFLAGSTRFRAVRPVDTATHPDFQGRGIFSRLTRVAIEDLEEDIDFIFNTPNKNSLPGYLKMGWQPVGRIPLHVRVRRPIRFLSSLRRLEDRPAATESPQITAPPADEILGDPSVADLLERIPGSENELTTPRSHQYLTWRYGSAPMLDYRAVIEGQPGSVTGVAVFRIRARGPLWEADVSEVIAPDRQTSGRLLRKVAKSAKVDHLICHFGFPFKRPLWRSGFLRTPRGITLVVNPRRKKLVPDPSSLDSWSLSLGDLEVF